MNITDTRTSAMSSVRRTARRMADRLQGQDVERTESAGSHRLGRDTAALQNAHLSQGIIVEAGHIVELGLHRRLEVVDEQLRIIDLDGLGLLG